MEILGGKPEQKYDGFGSPPMIQCNNCYQSYQAGTQHSCTGMGSLVGFNPGVYWAQPTPPTPGLSVSQVQTIVQAELKTLKAELSTLKAELMKEIRSTVSGFVGEQKAYQWRRIKDDLRKKP